MTARDRDTAHLTRWQAGRRRRRAATDRVTSLLFGILAAATLAFSLALYDLVTPVLG